MRVLDPKKLAEGVGFEPTVALATPVFKTGAFVRSAIPPSNSGEPKGETRPC